MNNSGLQTGQYDTRDISVAYNEKTTQNTRLLELSSSQYEKFLELFNHTIIHYFEAGSIPIKDISRGIL